MAQIVVALTGENANGILESQSERFLGLIRSRGLDGRLLRLGAPDFTAEWERALQDGILFAWAYAGTGARLSAGDRTVWDAARIPFVSVLADAPYIMPINHAVPSGFVVNGYVYGDWLEFQRKHVRSSQISALLPMGVLPVPRRDAIPWPERSRRMLFVKTGADPAAQRRRWNGWPARLRAVLNDSAIYLADRPPGPIEAAFEACMAAHGLSLNGNRALLFGMLHELDTFLRAHRATAMARALLPLPVDIVGGGWDHLDIAAARARLHPPMPSHALEAAFVDTQILVNTTPCFAAGAHERVLRGFASGCCVVSDENEYARAQFANLAAFRGVDCAAPDLPDRLAESFEALDATADDLAAAQSEVDRRHDPARFVDGLFDLAAMAHAVPAFAGYELAA